MPTYSYRCKNCDHAFDIHQAFSDDALKTCPSCGEERLRKVFGSVGVTFKGSGFYATDSRSSSSASAPAASSDSSSSDSSSSGSSSDSSSSGSSDSGGSSAKPAAASAPAAG